MPSRRWTAADVAKLSPKHQEQVRAAFARGDLAAAVLVDPELSVAPPKKRLRQASGPILNKLEERFLEKLQRDFPGHKIHSQAIRLELGRGIWYKPDFFLPEGYYNNADHLSPAAYEVKGPKVFRGGFENLKVAARVHPWIKFYLVWEDSDGYWQKQEVLP